MSDNLHYADPADLPWWNDAMEQLWEPYLRKVDSAFELQQIEEIVSFDHVVGVARLYVLPAFDSEYVVTCIFFERGIRVDSVRGTHSLWWTPQVDPLSVSRNSLVIAEAKRISDTFSSWEKFYEYSITAGCCSTDTADGVSFHHVFTDGRNPVRFHWSNPDRIQHSVQNSLVAIYDRLYRQSLGKLWFLRWQH